EYAADGDLVALAAGQTKIPTLLSLALAQANIGADPLAVFTNKIAYGIRLHSLDDTYLADPLATFTLLNSFELLRRECEPGAIVPSWTTSTAFYRGDELSSWTYFQVNNFNGRRIYGRTLGIESSDSGVFTILPNRVARAVGHGSASILASYGEVTGALPVSVGPVPQFLSPGGRSGYWFIQNPYIQDSLWLTGMTQVDSVTPLGEFVVAGGSVSYRYGGVTYSTPMLAATISPGGAQPTLHFRMATPEFPQPD